MRTLIAAALFSGALYGQTAAPEKDVLGRQTPQDSVFHFLEACHARDYRRALHYLDLRHMSQEQRTKDGSELAQQLEDLLDDTPFDITSLSAHPEGDLSDGLAGNRERLDVFHVDSSTIELDLEHVELKPGFRVWLVASDSVALIPKAHLAVAESPFEKKLPPVLVSVELLDTPIWRWPALAILALAVWMLAGLVAGALVAAFRPLVHTPRLREPIRVGLAVAGFRAAMVLAEPSALPRLFISRALGLLFLLALAWAGAVVVDMIAERWQSRMDPRVRAVSYSVLPLGRQIVKLGLYLIALLSVLSAWGYNTSTILAGLGVGGLAVALAAQKTIENLFGGISVIGDRPVLVGDVCQFGGKTGTVMHIGLRSTRIRTADRTVISVPNAQFSTMPLENVSGRDKIWFHPTLNLRRDTTSEQMLEVLNTVREILSSESKIETGKVPVRFVGVGPYSLDVEVSVYVATRDSDEFLSLQQDLLLRLLQAVERAGTALAVPLQESLQFKRT